VPSLSVLCPTRDPPARVRAILEPLRDVADEIVVAVDSRAPHRDFGHYAAVANRVLRYERGPTHSSQSWLHAQCRGDWVLSLAGDEVVGPELAAALPELVASRDALQYAVPFRWVHPDATRWLAQAPWHPDFHRRLVRNDATLRFAGRKHELALPVLPTRYLDLPLWHLNLVVLGEDARRAKVKDNEAERPGLLTADGRPLNAALYLPEDVEEPVTRPIPDADLLAIRAVLDPPAREARPLAPDAVPLAPRSEIEPLWAGREIGWGAYAAHVVASPTELRLRPEQAYAVHVRVSNEGDECWPWGLDLPPHIRIAYRWAGDDVPPEGRVPFPHDVAPGTDCIAPVPFVAPARRGEYTLEIDVCHEGVRWFGAACAVAVTVI
jgi:hypothetical protein